MIDILDDLNTYCKANGVQRLADIVGSVIDDGFEPFEAMA
jgi:hypothetical protein